MPAALEVDREQVRIVAVAVGVREAARQYGLNEDTVAAWSARDGWFKREATLATIQEQAIERKRENQGLQASASKPAVKVLQDYGNESRFFVAKGLHKGAEEISRMDGQEVVMSAPLIAQTVKSLSIVHDWPKSVQLNVLTDVLSSDGVELPDTIIDV